MIASQQGHIHIVSMLVDNGAHINLQNKVSKKTHAGTYLYDAVTQWSYFIMQEGVSALMIACSKGHSAIVQLLLDNNANTNLQTMVYLLN